MDSVNDIKATVMKWSGTDWENVGTPGFSAGYAYYTSIVTTSDGTPYVAYTDGANSDKVTVMKLGSEDPENGTTFKWYRDGEEISGATTDSYETQAEDAGSIITFGVKPKSVGNIIGTEAISDGL